jgi:hypothetical protein
MTVDSPRLVERAVNLYKLLESTLQDFESSTIDLVGTPWGFGDVIEYALENEVADNEMLMWKVGCYGKFEMSDHFKSNVEWTMPSGTPMSTEKLKYKGSEGEPIFPARAPREELQRLEKKYGPFLFSCNYLCNPFDPSQSGFRPEYLKYFKIQTDGTLVCERLANGQLCHSHGHKIHDLHIVMTVDPAFSDKDDAAESAIIVAGLAEDGCRFLFDAWGDRVESTDLMIRMLKTALQWSPLLKDVGVEAVASQKLFKDWYDSTLRVIPPEHWPEAFKKEIKELPDIVIHDLKPDGDIDKKRRIKSQQLPLGNGQWHIQYGMTKFLEQYTKFPRARPVDVIDAWSYCDYLWNIPKSEEIGASLGWNRLRREFHKENRPYGY